jgi:metal-dependent HD superfamily phosphatase/phosphodiesterase
MTTGESTSRSVPLVRYRPRGLLKRDGVGFNGARDQGLEQADEPVIIHLAATLHDIGHIVHRDDHPYDSIPLATRLLDRLLPELGYDTSEAVRMKGEIFHAILCHQTAEQPLTAEAGVVRIADALDVERGRSRIPEEEGGPGINTLSSQGIRRVWLRPREDRPVHLEIEITDAVGVFQVDELLKATVKGASLEAQIRIVALSIGEESGQRLVEWLEL